MDHVDHGPTGPGPENSRAFDDGSAELSASEHPTNDRVLAACCYLGPGFLVASFVRHRSGYLKWHTAQGFVLFFVEALALAFLVLLDATVGRIPLLGLVVMLAVRIALLVVFVVASAIGGVKAFAGEHVELPWIANYARRIGG